MSEAFRAEAARPASREREIQGLEWKFGRSQTGSVFVSGLRERKGWRRGLAVVAITRACAAEDINPLALCYAQFSCEVR
jgi:hypothetical protein